MRPSPINSISTSGTGQHDSMHSATYGAARGNMLGIPSTQPLLSPSELTSMYTRQFAASKTHGSVMYPTMPSTPANTASQTYTHGLTVLQCARMRGSIDPHVYRDWLIFEERLKQSYRRFQRKKRNYLVQIIAFGILVLYFAWFGFFGTKPYRFTCKLLSAGSAYCIYLIVTNRRFLQSIKYPAQCNRALHQFRLRFETSPLHTPQQLLVVTAIANASANASGDTTEELIGVSDSNTMPADGAAKSAKSKGDKPHVEKLPSFLTEPHLSFFPTVPRQLRDGYMEFKATYYRKRDAAKKRMQDRLQKSKQRKDSFSVSNHKISERKSRQRVHRTGLQLQMQSPEKMSDYNRSNSNSHSVSGIRSSNLSLSAGVDSAVDAAVASVTRSAALLAGIDSTTDDSSTTSSPAITPGTVTTRPAAERATSRLMYSFPEHDGMSSEGETHNDSTMSSHL